MRKYPIVSIHDKDVGVLGMGARDSQVDDVTPGHHIEADSQTIGLLQGL